ncbi:hypothetical protein C2E23DRAFT_699794, partial [Lenzites betulinus]
ITKFINALSAASETGGPAASANLLGQPDHYTDHEFKTFFWYGYVRRVLESAPHELLVDADLSHTVDTSTVMLASSGDRVVSLSKVDDYVWRPAALSSMSLYQFLRSTDIKLLPKKQNHTTEDDSSLNAVSACDESSGDTQNARHRKRTTRVLHFQHEHPRYATHGVSRRCKSDLWTLTFSGGVLPRPDRGDREEYCRTMLTLFAPGGWRSAPDLLLCADSWSTAFDNCEFDREALLVMSNMNVLYECQDARDDFSA